MWMLWENQTTTAKWLPLVASDVSCTWDRLSEDWQYCKCVFSQKFLCWSLGSIAVESKRWRCCDQYHSWMCSCLLRPTSFVTIIRQLCLSLRDIQMAGFHKCISGVWTLLSNMVMHTTHTSGLFGGFIAHVKLYFFTLQHKDGNGSRI